MPRSATGALQRGSGELGAVSRGAEELEALRAPAGRCGDRKRTARLFLEDLGVPAAPPPEPLSREFRSERLAPCPATLDVEVVGDHGEQGDEGLPREPNEVVVVAPQFVTDGFFMMPKVPSTRSRLFQRSNHSSSPKATS